MGKRKSRKLKRGDFEFFAEAIKDDEDLNDPEKFQNHIYEWHKKYAPEDIKNLKPEDVKVWHFNEETDSFELFQKS
jgi:hypothetical protein